MTDRCGIVHALRKHIVQRRRMRHPLARRFVAGIRGVDIARWREARDGWLLPMVQLALETAMRQGELRRLRWQHIDLNRRTAHLPDTKNGEAMTVPLSTTAARERAEHDGGRQHHRTQGPTHAAQVYASEGGGSGAEAGVNRVSIHRQRVGMTAHIQSEWAVSLGRNTYISRQRMEMPVNVLSKWVVYQIVFTCL